MVWEGPDPIPASAGGRCDGCHEWARLVVRLTFGPLAGKQFCAACKQKVLAALAARKTEEAIP